MLADLMAVARTDRLTAIRTYHKVDVERGGAGHIPIKRTTKGGRDGRLPILGVDFLLVRLRALYVEEALIMIAIVEHGVSPS